MIFFSALPNLILNKQISFTYVNTKQEKKSVLIVHEKILELSSLATEWNTETKNKPSGNTSFYKYLQSTKLIRCLVQFCFVFSLYIYLHGLDFLFVHFYTYYFAYAGDSSIIKCNVRFAFLYMTCLYFFFFYLNSY